MVFNVIRTKIGLKLNTPDGIIKKEKKIVYFDFSITVDVTTIEIQFVDVIFTYVGKLMKSLVRIKRLCAVVTNVCTHNRCF